MALAFQPAPYIPGEPIRRTALILEAAFKGGLPGELGVTKPLPSTIPLLLDVVSQDQHTVEEATRRFLKFRGAGGRFSNREDFASIVAELYWNVKGAWLTLEPASGIVQVADSINVRGLGMGYRLTYEETWPHTARSSTPRDLKPYEGLSWSKAEVDAEALEVFRAWPYEDGHWHFEGDDVPKDWWVELRRLMGLI